MVIFVTGTDTEVGKTFVCGLLARAFSDRGLDVRYQKWVSTGNRSGSEDADFVRGLLGREGSSLPGSNETPYCLELPASPHLAAEKAGIEIQRARIEEAFRELCLTDGVLVAEGVGGVLVPLSRKLLLADLVADLRMPVVIVARSGLGTINHTLLTNETCIRRGIQVLGVIYNSRGGEDPVLIEDNMRTISEMAGVECLGLIPRVDRPIEALPRVQPIADRIIEVLS